MESGFSMSNNEEDIEQLSLSTSILKLDLRSVKGRVGTKDLSLDFLSGSSIWRKAVQDLPQLSMDTSLMKLKAGNILVGDTTSFIRALVDESRLPLGMLLGSYPHKIDTHAVTTTRQIVSTL